MLQHWKRMSRPIIWPRAYQQCSHLTTPVTLYEHRLHKLSRPVAVARCGSWPVAVASCGRITHRAVEVDQIVHIEDLVLAGERERDKLRHDRVKVYVRQTDRGGQLLPEEVCPHRRVHHLATVDSQRTGNGEKSQFVHIFWQHNNLCSF